MKKKIRAGTILKDDVNTLKNVGASVRGPDGKLYGAGSRTAIGGFKEIEKYAAEKVGKWKPEDFKTFENWIKKFPCLKGAGGSPDIDCHIEGMRREKNLVVSGKGSRAMANKFIEGTTLARKGKFGLAGRAFLKNTVVGDIAFEAVYAVYNWLQGEDAADIWKLSWYSFADPNLWKDGKYIGWMADAEQAKLYTRTDDREFIYTDGKESKNPNFGKAIGIIPEIKR